MSVKRAKRNELQELQELQELHNAYNKHELVPYASVMVGSSYVTVYACACGGKLAYSSVWAKEGGGDKAEPYGHARHKNIRQEWLEPVIKLAAYCKPVGKAWMALSLNQSSNVDGLSASDEEVLALEKKYKLRR